MCNAASMILKQNDILWLKDSDSHEDIINHYNLNDKSRTPDFVRVEITPKNNDYKLPIKKWVYKVDQDYLPDWYQPKEAEKAVRHELKNWYKSKIINDGKKHSFKGKVTKIILNGDVTVDGMVGANSYCQSFNNSQLISTNQKGGDCVSFDNSQLISTNQQGGGCRSYGENKVKVVKE
jgi:hypothetical protein